MQPMNQGPPGMTPMASPSPMPQGVPGSPAQNAVSAPQLAELKNKVPPDQWQAFQQRMQQMPPEERMAALSALATDFGMGIENAQQDMTRADALRGEHGTPQGRMAGGVYQAANPLEHLSSVLNRKRLQGDYDKGKTARDEATAGADALRQKTMADLLRQ